MNVQGSYSIVLLHCYVLSLDMFLDILEHTGPLFNGSATHTFSFELIWDMREHPEIILGSSVTHVLSLEVMWDIFECPGV